MFCVKEVRYSCWGNGLPCYLLTSSGIEVTKASTKQILEATKVITESETRKTEILSDADEKYWRTNCNNINNEGGEGYVPRRATLEDVERAKSVLGV